MSKTPRFLFSNLKPNALQHYLPRPLTTSSLLIEPPNPSPSTTTTPTSFNPNTHCLSIAQYLINEGQYFEARNILHDRILCYSSTPIILSTLGFATKTGVGLNKSSYTLLIRVLVNSGEPRIAEMVYNDLGRKGIVDFYSSMPQSMIICYCRLGKLNEAVWHFEYILGVGLVPWMLAYDLLLCELCRNKRMIKAYELFSRMVQVGRFPSKWCYKGLIDGLCQNGSLDEVFYVFNEMIKSGTQPTPPIYTKLAYKYCEHGLFNEAELVCQQMESEGICADHTYEVIISMYCENRNVDHALKVMYQMFSHNLSLSVHCYTTLIISLYRERRVAEGMELLSNILARGIYPNIVMYEALLENCPKGEDVHIAREILQRIVVHGCNLYDVLKKDKELVFSTFLECKVIPANEAFHFLLKMLVIERKTDQALWFLQKMISHGCKPSISTYNSLVKAFCNIGYCKDPKSYLDLLKNHGIVPNLWTYLILIDERCKQQDISSAFTFLEEMNEKGLKPNVAVYDSIIGALFRDKKFAEVEYIFKRMCENGVAPDGFMYTTLINGYAKNGKADEAEILFDEMIKDGIRPCYHAYTALINGLAKKNMIEKVILYLTKMLKDGFSPDVVLYTTLIHQSCKKGDVSFAWNLWNAMPMKPDIMTYGSLVSGICKTASMADTGRVVIDTMSMEKKRLLNLISHQQPRNLKKFTCCSSRDMLDFAFELMRVVKKRGIMLDLHFYNSRISGFCRLKRMHDAYREFELLKKDGLVPNEVTCTILIDGHIGLGELDPAIRLFNNMKSYGCAPDKITYNTLIKGLCSTEERVYRVRVEDAVLLKYTMQKRGFFPSPGACERLIYSLCDHHASDLACNIFREMLLRGHIPGRYYFNRLLSMLVEEKELVEAHKLIDMMLQRGRSPDRKIKSLLFEAYQKYCQFYLAYAIQEDIIVYKDG